MDVDPALALVMTAIVVVIVVAVMIAVAIVIVVSVRAIDDAVMTVPALAAGAVTLLFDQTSARQAQGRKGDE